MIKPTRDEPYDVEEPQVVSLSNQWESVPECNLVDQLEQCSRQNMFAGKRIPFYLQRLCAADCLDMVVRSQNRMKSSHQKNSFIATSTAASVSQDLCGCLNTKVEKLVSDQVTVRFGVDFRFQQCLPREESQQDDEKARNCTLEALYIILCLIQNRCVN